ncbi:MAG: GNAT family N-acetyltransferase [Candidatus Nanohaloarchaea archaeon]
MDIREARRDEASRVVEELWMPLAREMEEVADYNALSEDAEQKQKEYRNDLLDELERVTFVAEEDGFVGFVSAKIEEPPPVFARGDTLHIAELYVREDHRRQGLATRLMENVLEWGRERGCEAVELNVDTPNREAIEFYMEQGFEEARKVLRKEL